MCRRARRVGQTLTVILLLAATRVTAEPAHIVTDEPRIICIPPAPSVTCRVLPPGHFIDGESWIKLDTELKRSQNSETSLRAQNDYLRQELKGWSPGWKTLTAAIIVGLAGGVYLGTQL